MKKLGGRGASLSFLPHPTRRGAAAREAGTAERLGEMDEWGKIEETPLHKRREAFQQIATGRRAAKLNARDSRIAGACPTYAAGHVSLINKHGKQEAAKP